jgi:hypothetical protein
MTVRMDPIRQVLERRGRFPGAEFGSAPVTSAKAVS